MIKSNPLLITIIISLGLFITLPAHKAYSNNISEEPESLYCKILPEEVEELLEQVKTDNKPKIRSMDNCKKSNRDLFAKIIDLNPKYFEFASMSLKSDEAFISKFVTLHPEILQYASPSLTRSKFFMFKMASIYPDALKYGSAELVDSKEFMMRMVAINPKNFAYSSERLQDNEELALLAFKSSGKMLRFASARLQDNQKLVMEAIRSYSQAIHFASERLQDDRKMKKLSNQINYNFITNLDDFLSKNYAGIKVGPDGSRGYHIVNMAKFFPEKKISDNPYLTKWERVYKNGIETSDFQLVSKQNNAGSWKVDFAEYPELIEEIENIFIANKVDQNTIDNLSAVSLWKISEKPQVLAFELYLLRQINSQYLKADTSNITLLTGIARDNSKTAIKENSILKLLKVKKKAVKKITEDASLKDKKWDISIVDGVFDADLKMNISYVNGHRRYKIWDVYLANDKDEDPKVLFKVEDKDGEYFDLFGKQINNRYASIYKGGGHSMGINLLEN